MSLNDLSIEQLDQLIEKATQRRIEAVELEARRRQAIEHVEKTAAVFGLRLEDLIDGPKAKSKKPTEVPTPETSEPSKPPRKKRLEEGTKRPWTEDEIATLIKMRDAGSTYREIAEVIDRTDKSIGVRVTMLRKTGRIPKT